VILYKFKNIHITLKKTFAKANECIKFLMFWGEYLHKTIIFSVPNTFKPNESGLLAHSNQRGGKKNV
jgi:hypothetical protein